MAGIINQTRFCIGNRQLLCSHTDLLRELCVIQTTVLINSGDRCVYCPCQSRFRLPINTTLLTSSRLHSHLHPPLARPLSLSLSLKSLPWRRRSAHASTRSHRPPRTLTRLAATRTPTRRLTRLRRTPQHWIGFGASTIFVYGSRCRRLRKQASGVQEGDGGGGSQVPGGL